MILMTREGAGVVITPDALEAALRERYATTSTSSARPRHEVLP